VLSRTGLPAAALSVGGPQTRVDVHYAGTILRQVAYAATVTLRRYEASTPLVSPAPDRVA
jgi:hypothetical protein